MYLETGGMNLDKTMYAKELLIEQQNLCIFVDRTFPSLLAVSFGSSYLNI